MVQDVSKPVTAEYCRHLSFNNTLNRATKLCCIPISDGISVWPSTPNNSYATIKCPEKAYNIAYNSNETATRFCMSNGTWDRTSNYHRCVIIPKVYDVLVIWFIGYTLSLLSCCVALILLRYFRSLRCLRNEIHCNLIASYICRVLIWYFNVLPQTLTNNWPFEVANIGWILLMFSSTANYFWMFVEGIYLFTLIVWTYGIERYNIWYYSIIGWGIPFLLTTLTVGLSLAKNASWINLIKDTEKTQMICIHIPILISIIVNIFIMAFIIYTLVIKLKQTKPPLRRNSSKFSIFSHDYKKAIKAAVVLIPLLGFTHCLVMYQPNIRNYKNIYSMIASILQSSQGFFVAVIYCFLNREVRFVLGARYRSFRGLLPNNNRNRYTREDSIVNSRRSNSIFKLTNPNDAKSIFQCRSQRILSPISDCIAENNPVIKAPLLNE